LEVVEVDPTWAWALEETATTRAGALCFYRSKSRLVSRNGVR
jgi:hypothetical protein